MKDFKRNRITFGLGTIGRDMVFTMMSLQLMFYLTEVLQLDSATFLWIAGIILALRIFDAVTDPVMGVIVDNTKTRFGKHKPWLATGAVLAAGTVLVIFYDFGLESTGFILLFAFAFLGWGLFYGINDIAYWSMLPNLSFEQKEREKIGSIARIFALCGTFFVVAGMVPITTLIYSHVGNLQQSYFYYVLGLVSIMLLGQLIAIFGIKENNAVAEKKQKTSLKDMIQVIFKNDQLLWIVLALGLFMVGYTTTVSFGLHYFEYIFMNIDMFSVFALILGVSQIISLALFPLVSKFLKRKTIYLLATILVVVGYIIFFFAPLDTMIFIGIAGILIFLGQAAIQLIMLLFISDTVDYGHLKLNRRNDSITFSLQAFIFKIGSAIAGGIVGITIVITGIPYIEPGEELPIGAHYTFLSAMLLLPLVCIVLGFIIYKAKFKIDEQMHQNIIKELKERGEIDA